MALKIALLVQILSVVCAKISMQLRFYSQFDFNSEL